MTKMIFEWGEKSILLVIGAGAFAAALIEIYTAIIDYDLQIEKLFTLFIYAEIIGMVGGHFLKIAGHGMEMDFAVGHAFMKFGSKRAGFDLLFLGRHFVSF